MLTVAAEGSAVASCASGSFELSIGVGLWEFAEAAPAVVLVIAISPSQAISEPAFAQPLGKTIIQRRGLQFINRTDV